MVLLSLALPGAYLYGCYGTGTTSPALAAMGLTDENMAELLLPPTKEFTFVGSLDEAVQVAVAVTMLLPLSLPLSLSLCTIRLQRGRAGGRSR